MDLQVYSFSKILQSVSLLPWSIEFQSEKGAFGTVGAAGLIRSFMYCRGGTGIYVTFDDHGQGTH